MGRRIAVTGASGLLGRALVRRLADCGATVVALSRQPLPVLPNVSNILLSSYADIPELTGVRLVHLAERADVTAANAAGRKHVEESMALATALLCRPWDRTVYASSANVYVDTGHAPKRIDAPVSASNIYAESKLAVENAFLGRGGAVARLSNVYGVAPTPGTVFAEILAQIPGASPVIVRDVTPVRDFIWVEDAASALAALVLGEPAGVYNVGSGTGYSIEEVVFCALSMAGNAGRSVHATSRSSRPSSIVLDISQTTAAFDWRPTVPLSEGLRRMLRS